jgi:hypothetical protein
LFPAEYLLKKALKPMIFPILVHTTVHVGSIFGWLARIVELWLFISMSSIVLIVIGVGIRSKLIGIKLQMAKFDRTMPLPLFDRRKRRQTRFPLRLTRRQVPPTEAKMVEKLNHAIDYLIDTYDLRKYSSAPDTMLPAEFIAVQKLLQCRAEILKQYSPLPSFSYLLKRRFAYLMNIKWTWM